MRRNVIFAHLSDLMHYYDITPPKPSMFPRRNSYVEFCIFYYEIFVWMCFNVRPASLIVGLTLLHVRKGSSLSVIVVECLLLRAGKRQTTHLGKIIFVMLNSVYLCIYYCYYCDYNIKTAFQILCNCCC